MPRSESSIKQSIAACSQWLARETGKELDAMEVEQYFRRRVAEIRTKHIADRFESYSLGECISALKLLKNKEVGGAPCDVPVPSGGSSSTRGQKQSSKNK